MAMSGEQIEAHVRNAMMGQQAELLEIGAENALKLVQEQHKRNSTALMETIDEEFDKSREHDNHNWQNPINKSNFDALRQVKQMWERTERVVGVIGPSPEQKELKDGAMKFIKEGKKLTRERLKVLRYAIETAGRPP